jgi:hypothetical protein
MLDIKILAVAFKVHYFIFKVDTNVEYIKIMFWGEIPNF